MDKNNLLEDEKNKALEQLEEWHLSESFEIDGMTFKFTGIKVPFRIKVYALYSQIETNIILGNFGFLEDAKFKELFKEVENKVLFEDMLISKIPNFWEENQGTLLDFIQVSLKLISYGLHRKKKDIN